MGKKIEGGLIISTPVMEVGFESGGKQVVLPFYRVDISNEKGVSKRLLVNYTFGTHSHITQEISFESEMGQIKFQLLNHLLPSKPVVLRVIKGKTETEIKQKILDTLKDEPGGSRILMVYPRDLGDDTPFFEAMNLVDDNGEFNTPGNVLSLGDLGLEIESPFQDLSQTGTGGAAP